MTARILVAEDNEANRELMTYLLKAFGYSVVTAANGREGIESARKLRPDVFICDVQMPDMDGFEVARRMKSDPELCSIPLVAVTALAMVGDRERALGAGFDGYVSKPINPETFVREVEAYLPFPIASASQAASSADAAVSPKEVDRRATVLVVDNLAVNLDLARSILEPSGFEVFCAMNADEGLALARKRRCDLILSDVGMSKGSGFDFLRAVRADAALCQIPFILITSTFPNESDRVLGLKLGASRYLTRPIEPEALLTVIRDCLQMESD